MTRPPVVAHPGAAWKWGKTGRSSQKRPVTPEDSAPRLGSGQIILYHALTASVTNGLTVVVEPDGT